MWAIVFEINGPPMLAIVLGINRPPMLASFWESIAVSAGICFEYDNVQTAGIVFKYNGVLRRAIVFQNIGPYGCFIVTRFNDWQSGPIALGINGS
jgi:hypothetical protein